jgi:SPX domain protein involved in polyphosphate accumulation
MKFGTTLRRSVYAPWKAQYIEYDKLKKLLKDNEDDYSWTAEDESAFVDELANVQLEKVHGFITDISQKLRDRTTACEKKLEPLAIGLKSEGKEDAKDNSNEGEGLLSGAADASSKPAELSQADREKLLKDVLSELDNITKETKELEGFSRINFTAVIKATKKHDKLRGSSYKLRPFIDARLARHPLHTEDASPLLYRLSALYSFVRQSLEGKPKEKLSFSEGTASEGFTSHKCMAFQLPLWTFILIHHSLGPHGQPLRGQDSHPPPPACPRLQLAVSQHGRWHPERPHNHLVVL